MGAKPFDFFCEPGKGVMLHVFWVIIILVSISVLPRIRVIEDPFRESAAWNAT